MPRAGWVKPESEVRLSDHISIGLLTKTYPPELVDAVVASTGRTQLRHRLLPARVVVYYVMALSLYSQASYEEVMRFLVQGLSWLTHWRKGWQVPTKAAIFKSRQRLGVEPMQELFRVTARPLAGAETEGAWYRGWRVMALDGSLWGYILQRQFGLGRPVDAELTDSAMMWLRESPCPGAAVSL